MKHDDDVKQAKPREEYLSSMDCYECKQCGYIYNPGSQELPEDATSYWVPHCPYCNSKITQTVVDDITMEAANWTLKTIPDDEPEKKRKWMGKIQARARHLHGKEVHKYADNKDVDSVC